MKTRIVAVMNAKKELLNPSKINLNEVRSPVIYFPTSGKLAPGCTQTVEVEFTPNIPQYELYCDVVLKTEDIAEREITIHGTGASSRIAVLDSQVLDFGILRLGTMKSMTLKLKNHGILGCRYFLDCSHKFFSSEPERGVLDGEGVVDINVKFAPTSTGTQSGTIIISGAYGEGFKCEPVIIKIIGTGSYPELVVLTKAVDFGTALYNTPNTRQILVENTGAAEAQLMFNSHHRAVFLESGSNLIVSPKSKRNINIVYHPTTIENLDIKVFLRSSDSRGDYFMIHLRGLVGMKVILIFRNP